MSRGLGRVERSALGALRRLGRAATLVDIASAAEGLSASDATYRSYARALRGLVRKGFVADMERGSNFRKRVYELGGQPILPHPQGRDEAAFLPVVGQRAVQIVRDAARDELAPEPMHVRGA